MTKKMFRLVVLACLASVIVFSSVALGLPRVARDEGGQKLVPVDDSRTESPVVAVLSYDLVNFGPHDVMHAGSDPQASMAEIRIGTDTYYWHQIVVPSGKLGWVPGKYVRTAFDTRLYFERIDGVWKLVSITGGD